MAKIFLVCTKSSSLLPPYIPQKIQAICRELIPEIITPNPSHIIEKGNMTMAIANPVSTLNIRGEAVCLGVMFGEPKDWWKIGADIPDGNFALYRFNDQIIEVATDDCGSRNVWYYQDEEVFIVSSSQRAIIQYLGSFEPNEEAFPWMLSVGSLLFGMSWDKRIKPLSVCSRLTLDIKDWSLTTKQSSLAYEVTLPHKESKIHKEEFVQAFNESFQNMNYPAKDWFLPLSGGVDSRSLLVSLPQNERLSTVTWGDQRFASNNKSDASIARKLAEKFGNPHQFLPILPDKESIETVIDRYIRYTEGMTDNIAGYIDGFHVWKQLFEEGYSGYIRGDRAISTREPKAADNVIADLEIRTLDFYENGKKLAKCFPPQILPEEMNFKAGKESLSFWRVRLIFLHYAPSIYAALTESKAGFLESSYPLKNRKIYKYSLPLTDRVESVYDFYKEHVLGQTPNIPVAEGNSNVELKDILRSKEMVNLMKTEFNQVESSEILSSDLIQLILKPLKINTKEGAEAKPLYSTKLKKLIKKMVPEIFLENREEKKKYHLDPNLVAFRAFIILRIIKQLNKDAQKLIRHTSAEAH